MGSGQRIALGPLNPRGLARPGPHMRLFLHYPQGIKKPYNPILGETFRCRWFHPHTDSHTFYIAEQARAPLGCRRALGQGLAVGGEPGPMGASSGPHVCCSEALSCQDPPRRRRLCTLAGDSVSISLGHPEGIRGGFRGCGGPRGQGFPLRSWTLPGRGRPLLGPFQKPLLCPQVSHHPPVSAFHVSNRKDGFCISGSITAKSRFYGEGSLGLPWGLGKWEDWGPGGSRGHRDLRWWQRASPSSRSCSGTTRVGRCSAWKQAQPGLRAPRRAVAGTVCRVAARSVGKSQRARTFRG